MQFNLSTGWTIALAGLAVALRLSAQNFPTERGRMAGSRSAQTQSKAELNTIDIRNPSSDRFSRVSLILSICPQGESCNGSEPNAKIVQSRSFAPGDSGTAQFGLSLVQQTCKEARQQGQVCSVSVAQCIYPNQQSFEENPRCKPRPSQTQALVAPESGCQQRADGRAQIDLGCMRSAAGHGG